MTDPKMLEAARAKVKHLFPVADFKTSLQIDAKELGYVLAAFASRRASEQVRERELAIAKHLHINFCEELREEGDPWEVPAEPEPQYFETLEEAIEFLVNLREVTDAH